jgi:ParB family chromosome partitioning protein
MAPSRRETISPEAVADGRVCAVAGSADKSLEVELWQLEQPYAELRIRTPRQLARLSASLLEQGQTSPIVIVEGGEPGRYVLIDGHSRVRALGRCGNDVARALLVPLAPAEALAWSYRQESGPRRSPLEEGWLVRELRTSTGTLGAVAELVGRSKSWVSRRLGLVEELPEAIQSLVRGGAVGAHAAMKSLLPLARANAAAATRIAEIASREELTSREIEELCRGWYAAPDPDREQLFEKPRLYLAVTERLGNKKNKGERPPLVSDFELLAAVARRSERVLRRGDDDQSGAREAIAVVWPRTEEALERLAVAVEERRDAGLGDASGDSATPS